MASASSPPHCRLVNIGTHSLALYTHGPEPSDLSDPVVLFISGVASDALNWQAVVRELSPSLRSYTYDRSDYNNSELSPLAPTAENAVIELSGLIEKATIVNPLIIVTPGLAYADDETAPQVLNVNEPIVWTVAGGVEPYSAWGVEANHKLTADEWAAFRAVESTDKYGAIAQKEDEQYFSSFETLRKKNLANAQPLLGDKPVFVIGGLRSRDWSGLYEAGVARGNGSEEQRAHVRNMIANVDKKSEGLMKEFLKLSTKSELVFAKESGHFVQLTQPEVVVYGVRRILQSRTA